MSLFIGGRIGNDLVDAMSEDNEPLLVVVEVGMQVLQAKVKGQQVLCRE